MSGPAPPWRLAIVTGMLGSGKTTMISRLLRRADMADTLVLVNEFGEIGLDHALFRAVSDNVILLPNGCLCCTIRSDIVQTLREIHRGWLTGAVPDFGRVIIETTGLAEPSPLIASIVSTPLIAESFELQTLSTLVDCQYIRRQVADNPTCRNQVRAADHLILSKSDLVDDTAMAALTGELRAHNGLATVRPAGAVDPEWLYDRNTPKCPRSSLHCDETSDHLAGISTVTLRPGGPLSWSPFRIWLSDILDAYGPRLLRLKGRLTFDASETSVIIQAVHHTFYPLAAVNGPSDSRQDFIVMIFEGEMPPELKQNMGGFVLN